MHCPHCGREAPDGRFCGYCGASLTTQGRPRPRRRHAYAAHPHEHVLHPSVVTTFFPHLNVQRTQQLRWILLGGAVLIFLLGLGRLVPLAIVASALFAPLLYLFYFVDVEIYENEPLRVLGGTFLLGALLGAALNLALYRALLSVEYTLPGEPPSTDFLLLSGAVLPLVSLALMLVGPLVLFSTRRRFKETLDGLAFGVASGLGFAAAQSLIFSWQLVTGPFQEEGEGYTWALPMIKTAVLLPLLFGAAAGLVCAVLWLRRDPTPPRRQLGALASLPIALGLATLALVVPALGSALGGNEWLTLAWYGGALLVVMLVLRHVLHLALVEKAHELGHGGTMRCPHCQHLAPDVAFCPSCGLALRSAAKRHRRQAQAGSQSQQQALVTEQPGE
jgi:RsiW-degrading membrane proteinase PrsW (M82 family)